MEVPGLEEESSPFKSTRPELHLRRPDRVRPASQRDPRTDNARIWRASSPPAEREVRTHVIALPTAPAGALMDHLGRQSAELLPRPHGVRHETSGTQKLPESRSPWFGFPTKTLFSC